MSRLEIENSAPRLLRPLHVMEAIGVDPAELLENDELLRCVRCGDDAPLEDLGDRLVILVPLRLLFERIERPGRGRIFFEELAVKGRRIHPAVEALRGDLRHLEPDLPPLGPRRHPLCHPIEEVVERLEGAPLRVELPQLCDRLHVVRRELRQLLVRLERVLHVRKLFEPPPSDRAQEARPSPPAFVSSSAKRDWVVQGDQRQRPRTS